MRRIIAIVAGLLLVAGAAFLVQSQTKSQKKKGKTYTLTFDNAFGLTEGGDVRVGGVRAGKILTFDTTDGEPPKAEVEIQVTEPGFADFRRDAFCQVRPQSLIGEYYVDCQPGKSKQKLRGPLPVQQTASTIPTDLLNNVLRRPYRERLRLIIAELGTGLAGRPEELGEVLRRAHPALRETSRTLGILARQDKIIQNFITDSDTVIRELEARKRDVVRFVREAGETAEISASRRGALQAQFRRLPTFLAELEPTMVRLGQLADEQVPTLRSLQAAAPDLNRFLTELGPFSEASRPAVRSLGRTSVVGSEALRESREEIAELRRVARDAPALGKPLRQWLQSLDDRRRSTEDDPRARDTAPPPPDRNAYRPGQGFTGMEAIMNYIYWQTLGINAFDDVSHFLRIVGIIDECSRYQANPPASVIRACNNYLGPYQPGVPNATGPSPSGDLGEADPDPTEGDRQPGKGVAPLRPGEGPRGAGDPEAPPIPGQPDPSRPQFALPEQVQQTIEAITRPPSSPAPDGSDPQDGDGPGPERLLDFLMAP